MKPSVDNTASGAILRFCDTPLPEIVATQHRSLLIDAFNAAAEGNKEPFWQLFDPAVVLYEPSCLPYGGQHVRFEAAKQAYARVHGTFFEIRGELEEVLASQDLAIAYQAVTFRAHQGDREITMPVAEVYRFVDGKIVEWRPHYFDPALIARLLAVEAEPVEKPAACREATTKPQIPDEAGDPSAARRNREIFVSALKAMVAGDAETWWSMYDPDVVFHEASSLPYGGAHFGIAAVKRAYAQIHVAFDAIRASFEAVMAAGDIVIAYQQIEYSARKGRKTGSFPVAELFRFHNEKVIEWRALYFDADAIGKTLTGE